MRRSFKFSIPGAGSAAGICIIYTFAALVVIVVFRFIYPDFAKTDSLLDIFWFKARLCRGIAHWIEMFPAIFMSALVIPFALRVYGKKAERRFSSAFFDSMKPNLHCCIAGTVVYTLLYLIVSPNLASYAIRIQSQSQLYASALQKAETFAKEDKWREAAEFFSMCERIWPRNPGQDGIREKIAVNMERLHYGRAERPPQAKRVHPSIPNQPNPINATEALGLARRALNDGRYYDAHWLANTASLLAREGSAETAEAVRLASLAWNAISRIEDTPQDEAFFSVCRKKREGYEALDGGEWLRAFYIFNALSQEAPGDPDVRNFLAISEEGLLQVAFFLDEMDMVMNDVLNNVVFSLPGVPGTGRMVLRMESFAHFEDVAFGRGIEAIGFSVTNEPVWRLSSDIAKILPLLVNDTWYTVLLFRAVDRNDGLVKREPLWSGGGYDHGGGQLLLPIPFDELVLAATVTESYHAYYLHDLWDAAQTLGNTGFVPQVFQTEIVRAVSEIAFFPSMSVLVLIVGWKFRARFQSRYSLVPMFVVLPLVFSTIFALLRIVCRSVVISVVVQYGIATALLLSFVTAALLFIVALFLLSAQRSEI